jgi:hypothetical protein
MILPQRVVSEEDILSSATTDRETTIVDDVYETCTIASSMVAHHNKPDHPSAATAPRTKSLPSALEEGAICSVCLEPFQVGDAVAHSSGKTTCQHVFHEDCIVSWFASYDDQQSPSKRDCPCCRQRFASEDHTTMNTTAEQHPPPNNHTSTHSIVEVDTPLTSSASSTSLEQSPPPGSSDDDTASSATAN